MNEHEVREGWTAFHRSAGVEAVAARSSHTAVFALFDRYRSLSPHDRETVDRLLAEQLGSDDETTRFDALAVIDEFGISSALPELRALADRLEDMPGPGAPYEWAKVNRLIGDLKEGQGPPRR